MSRFIALLRGVNVGRGNRVPMAEFRTLLESLGFSEVRTLLNSGNAVFSGRSGSLASHAKRIRTGLVDRLDVDVPVIVKSDKELAAIASENPLASKATDPSRLLVAFTADAKALRGLSPIQELTDASERFSVGKYAAYLWCPHGILQSKAGEALLGKRGQGVTTRNWATVLKIIAMIVEDDR